MGPSSNGKIIVLGTGGTIAGTAPCPETHVAYTAAQLSVQNLLDTLTPLRVVLGTHSLVAEQVAQIDSKDMTFSVWQQLAARCVSWLADPEVIALVITHGTDTLEETAWYLASVLPSGKPVVMTCSMRPATAMAPDGPQNLLDAVTVARHPAASGVVAVVAGTIHAASALHKSHPYRLDAFDSGETGPLGFVEDGRVRWERTEANLSTRRPGITLEKLLSPTQPPRVEIVLNHADADGRLVDLLVHDGVDGLIAAGTGNGTLHRGLDAALRRAQDRGVRVVRATRCERGRVLHVPDDPYEDAHGLSPVKARISLMLELIESRPSIVNV